MAIAPEQYQTTLQQDYAGEDRWTLNFGPQHPATHTTLRLILELDGERVVNATPHIGYLHSGFEKIGEHLNYNQYVVVTDRMNYISPVANNIAWHTAVEKLFGLELTPRATAIRTLCAELARIQDHMLNIGTSGLDLGGFTPFLYAFNARETIYDLMEELTGARFTVSYTRVGGVAQDIPAGWIDKLLNFTRNQVPKVLDEVEGLLNRNRIFIERTKGIGYISAQDAINWSLTGVMARASGVRRDLRKDEPYLCYADNWDGNGAPAVQFKVPLATGGDVYSRYLVRIAETREACKIIDQVVDMLPNGPINTFGDDATVMPDKREIYFSIEGLIHHFEHVMTNRGLQPPVGEAYGANETANGELGFFLASDGGNAAYRASCRPPSFIHFSVFPKLMIGHQISDVVAVLNSINIIAAELDR